MHTEKNAEGALHEEELVPQIYTNLICQLLYFNVALTLNFDINLSKVSGVSTFVIVSICAKLLPRILFFDTLYINDPISIGLA